MFKIGLDLGYGYVKGISEDQKSVLFPSLVGNAYERNLAGLFGGNSSELTDNIHLSVLDSDGQKKEYFIGELARREGKNISFAFDNNKITHPNTKALLVAATALLTPKEDVPVHIVSGLPLEQYIHQKNSFQEMIKKIKMIVEFKGYNRIKVVKFEKVTIFPQAAGAVYAAIWDQLEKYLIRGSFLGLIDIGQKTTDYIVFYVDTNGKLVLREDLSGTIDFGMANLNNAADKLFTQKTGAKLDIPELMQLVKENQIFYKGEMVNLEKELEMVKAELARTIKDRIKLAWGNKMDFFNSVFLAGGGAKTLYTYMKDIYSNTILVKQAQMANAEGFLKVAKMAEKGN